jgi:thiamine-phosphate pyrophosphorylase
MHLYAITDRRLLTGPHEAGKLSAAERDGLVGLAGEWATAGVEFVQLREKDLAAPELTVLVEGMVAAIRENGSGGGPRLLLNAGAPDAWEVARMRGVAGLHLPGKWRAEQVGWARIRGMVSVGCHSVAEVAVARVAGADMALLSPIFRTQSHPKAPPLGVEALTEAHKAARRMPVFALGGVDMENAAACIEAGAAGVAGIRTFLSGRWPAAEPTEVRQG